LTIITIITMSDYSSSSSSFKAVLPARIVLSLIGTATAVGGYLADWNETHVFNPKWSPHAKFHNGQTMSTGLALASQAMVNLLGAPGALTQTAPL
jgi:hypothetical protein